MTINAFNDTINNHIWSIASATNVMYLIEYKLLSDYQLWLQPPLNLISI